MTVIKEFFIIIIFTYLLRNVLRNKSHSSQRNTLLILFTGSFDDAHKEGTGTLNLCDLVIYMAQVQPSHWSIMCVCMHTSQVSGGS